MKKSIVAAIATLFLANFAYAADSCDAQAASKKLAGAAKTSFLKKCEADMKGAASTSSCDDQAASKKLAGAAKTSFLKKCEASGTTKVSDAAGACDAKAKEKKLAGAAKNSFVKKCVADAK